MAFKEAPVHGLLVSGAVAASDGQRLIEACAASGMRADLVLHDPDHPPGAGDAARITCALLSVDVIGNSTKTQLERELATFVDTLRRAPNLQWLQVCSAGMDRDFFAELHARGVRLTSAAGANSKAVAQTAVAGLLALARGVPHWVAAQREHRWVPLRGELTPVALEGQHAVVVGMGGIGLDIGRLLAALELRVTGVRRTPAPAAHFDRVIGLGQLDDVLPEADWLVLACPLTEDTRHLVNAARLSRMRPGARIVNVARGEVIDEAALTDALRRKAIAGAYLDVFTVEPLPAASPLWDLENVLVSPHSAGNSSGHPRNVIELFRSNLVRLCGGEPLINEWRARTPAT